MLAVIEFIRERTSVQICAANFCRVCLISRDLHFKSTVCLFLLHNPTPHPSTPVNYLNMTSLIAARSGIYKSAVKLRALRLCNQRRADYLLTSGAFSERAQGVFPGGRMFASSEELEEAFKDPVHLKYLRPSSDETFQTHLSVSCPIKADPPPPLPPKDPGVECAIVCVFIFPGRRPAVGWSCVWQWGDSQSATGVGNLWLDGGHLLGVCIHRERRAALAPGY